MANNKEISIEMIAQIATLAAKTAVDEMLERRQEEVFTRCRDGITGMKQHRHNGHSPACTYADKVTYVFIISSWHPWVFCLIYFHFVCLLINVIHTRYVKLDHQMR